MVVEGFIMIGVMSPKGRELVKKRTGIPRGELRLFSDNQFHDRS